MDIPPSGAPRLGWYVKQRRIDLQLSQAAAAKRAGVNRMTWRPIEAGVSIPFDHNRAAIERALGWQPGSCDTVLAGGDPITLPVPPSADRPQRRTAAVHMYVSTYCVHELHGDCRLTCKTCEAQCLCSCHAKW